MEFGESTTRCVVRQTGTLASRELAAAMLRLRARFDPVLNRRQIWVEQLIRYMPAVCNTVLCVACLLCSRVPCFIHFLSHSVLPLCSRCWRVGDSHIDMRHRHEEALGVQLWQQLCRASFSSRAVGWRLNRIVDTMQ